MKVGKLSNKLTAMFAGLLIALSLNSCVHEVPELPQRRNVALLIKHELPWSLFYFDLPVRSTGDLDGCSVGYTIELYPHGSTDFCIERIRFISDDITLSDFFRILSVPTGNYDLWIWSDYVDSETGASPFYNSANFAAIKLLEPYRGDTYRKDAFEGLVEITVPDTDEAEVEIAAEVTLRRPLTGYAFIANDVKEFLDRETRRLATDKNAPSQAPTLNFDNYVVKITYPGFIPNTYSMFRNKPIDSMSGVSYSGSIELLESGDALLAFDTAFINGEESTLTITLEVFDDSGELISAMPGIIIPTKRNRATIVEAPFLTTKAEGGVDIDTSFTDDYDIKI